MLRWGRDDIQFVSPDDLSTTYFLCRACGERRDLQKVFVPVVEGILMADEHQARCPAR